MIQYRFKNPGKIVPIVIGTRSPQSSKDLALALLPFFKPENLFIISTNFSNYPSYSDAIAIDKISCDAILSNSPEEFYNTLRTNGERNIDNLVNSTYGWGPILTLLYMSSLNKEIINEPLLYRNSGDLPEGNKERVIGYWAIASYFEPGKEEEDIISKDGKKQLLDISRSTLESFIIRQELPDISSSTVEDQLKEPASLFVSLYMNGRLRGSVGQIAPIKPLYIAIQEMTAAAAVTDQRFAPVEPPELDYIKIEVSVLTPLVKIDDISDFEPGIHGIHIVKGEQSGTLLPQAAKDQDWSSEEFISYCSEHIAGIGRDGWMEADLYVFEALVFSED
jgi:AmmeMemoRadiSam system protein A